MFRYQDTGKQSKPKELQRRVVTEIRKVTYLNDSPDPKVADPVVTFGYETVKEITVSPEYAREPKVVDEKTIDNRDPNRVVEYTESRED